MQPFVSQSAAGDHSILAASSQFFLDGITGIVSHQKRGSHTGPHRIGTDGSWGHESSVSVDVENVRVPLVKVY